MIAQLRLVLLTYHLKLANLSFSRFLVPKFDSTVYSMCSAERGRGLCSENLKCCFLSIVFHPFKLSPSIKQKHYSGFTKRATFFPYLASKDIEQMCSSGFSDYLGFSKYTFLPTMLRLTSVNASLVPFLKEQIGPKNSSTH